jgi:hypothetical protein
MKNERLYLGPEVVNLNVEEELPFFWLMNKK